MTYCVGTFDEVRGRETVAAFAGVLTVDWNSTSKRASARCTMWNRPPDSTKPKNADDLLDDDLPTSHEEQVSEEFSELYRLTSILVSMNTPIEVSN